MIRVIIYSIAPGLGFGYGPGEHSVSRKMADKLIAAKAGELVNSPVETAEITTPTPRKRKKK